MTSKKKSDSEFTEPLFFFLNLTHNGGCWSHTNQEISIPNSGHIINNLDSVPDLDLHPSGFVE